MTSVAYVTSFSENELIEMWFKEYKIEIEGFIPWELAEVSNDNKDWVIYYYIWKNRKWQSFIEDINWIHYKYDYIRKIQPNIKIKTIDWQELEISKEEAIKLWFKIN
jgi:hypothetical protein